MERAYDGGIYLLEIYLAQVARIRIGRKGIFQFPAGYYYYAGTAQRNLKARLRRHLRKQKPKHWHIDYLLARARLTALVTWPEEASGECRLAEYLSSLGGQVIMPGFGASDCHCLSHLYYFPKGISLDKIGSDLFGKRGDLTRT